MLFLLWWEGREEGIDYFSFTILKNVGFYLLQAEMEAGTLIEVMEQVEPLSPRE